MSRGHDHIEQTLTDFLAGGLNDTEQNEVQTHLDSCPLCREKLASLQETIAVLERNRDSGVPEGYFGTILPRLRQRIDRPRRLGRLLDLRWPQWAAPLAAAILVAGLLTAIPLTTRETLDLAALTRELEADDLADAYFDALQTSAVPVIWPDDPINGTVAGLDLSNGVLNLILDENVLQELGTVEDLNQEEVETILRQLETRTLL